MSTENRSNLIPPGTGQSYDLAKRIAELEEMGIVSGSGGGRRRASLQDVTTLPPEALQWFLDQQYKGHPEQGEK